MKRFGVLGAIAMIGACSYACGAFIGEATKPEACPVLCGHYQGAAVCCAAHESCSRTGWPDAPCRPRDMGPMGAARDAGR